MNHVRQLDTPEHYLITLDRVCWFKWPAPARLSGGYRRLKNGTVGAFELFGATGSVAFTATIGKGSAHRDFYVTTTFDSLPKKVRDIVRDLGVGVGGATK